MIRAAGQGIDECGTIGMLRSLERQLWEKAPQTAVQAADYVIKE